MKNEHNFKSLQRGRLYEEMAGSLKQAIFGGEYRVGDKLPSESELAELFGVSRPVAREAIRYLEITGLVTVRQGATGGAFVAGINSSVLKGNVMDLLTMGQVSVGQLTEMRAHIEPEIARLAALRAGAEDVRELEESVQSSISPAPESSFLNQVENNARFHRLLGRASRNLFYAIIEDILMDFTVEFIRTVPRDQGLLHNPDEHKDLLQAIKNREPERAEAITREHIAKIGSQMQDLEGLFLELTIPKNVVR
ncbi:MAG: FadR family transcriptional regulator [Desulfomonile tiedjei]|nr:FadR family transcriptional regulator [Desulfomonile tiedjei]